MRPSDRCPPPPVPRKSPAEMELFEMRTALLSECLGTGGGRGGGESVSPYATPSHHHNSPHHYGASSSPSSSSPDTYSFPSSARHTPPTTASNKPSHSGLHNSNTSAHNKLGGGRRSHGPGGPAAGVRQAYLDELRAKELAWRRWADAPLLATGGNASGREDGGGHHTHHSNTTIAVVEQVSGPHPAALPYQYLGRPAGATTTTTDGNPFHLALHMKAAYRATTHPPAASGLTSARPVFSAPGNTGSSSGRCDTSAAALRAVADELTARHEVRCRQQQHRLHSARVHQGGSGWGRALPAYAAADRTPRLMDMDLRQTFSRVDRTVRDTGAVVM